MAGFELSTEVPTPWFADDAADVSTGAHLVELARTYVASREATIRRFAEIHSKSVAAVYLSWKLKPVQERTIGNLDQYDLFGADPAEIAHQAKKLRVDYSVPSSEFAQAGHYLPNDKSVEQSGPVYEAASTGQPCEGECWLDFGTTVGRFRVFAVPLWTDDQDLGPSGENAVGAIIEPLELRASKGKAVNSDPRWFD